MTSKQGDLASGGKPNINVGGPNGIVDTLESEINLGSNILSGKTNKS